MSLLARVKNYMYGIDVYDEYEYENSSYYGDEEEVQEDLETIKTKKATRTTKKQNETQGDSKSPKIVDLHHNQKSYVVIATPKNINDSVLIIDSVKDTKLCIVNLEGVEQENAQKIADFLSGAIYALNGEIQRVSNDIFVCAAANVDISGAIEATLKSSNSGILPWLTKN